LALKRAGWPDPQRISTTRTAAVVLTGWFAIAAGLSWLGAYQAASDGVPTIQYGIAAPILVGVLLLWRSPFVGRILDAVPQSWIIGVQFYRALGLIFLVLYAGGMLPGLFAWPAGVGDIAVGVLALLVAWRVAAHPQAHAADVQAWNLFGIADLAVAVGTGFLTSPSLLQMFAFDNPNEIVSAYPLALIPVFLVPLSILLHVASLMKLWRQPAGSAVLYSA
jgi:hypothetical protein